MGGGTLMTTDDLNITVDESEGRTLVRLNGRLNIDSSPELRELLLALLRAESPQAITIDMSAVSYIDASGIATLVEGLKFARNRTTRLCLEGLQGRALHLFQATGMLPLFEANGCKDSSSPTSKVL